MKNHMDAFNAFRPITNAMKKASLPPIAGSILFYIFVLFGIILLISGLGMLLKMRGCGITPAGAYEQFANSDDDYLTQLKSRIESLSAVKNKVEDAVASLNDSADETCNIMKELEQVYVGNSAAPSDPSEFSLPKAIQEKRRSDRERRAVSRFAEERALFSAAARSPILECFAAGNSVTEAETELAGLCDELTVVLDSAEVKMMDVKKQKIRTLMDFNGRYLKKALNTATAEGFYSDLRGPALLVKADTLLGKASTIYDDIMALKNDVKLQRTAVNQLTKRGADLQNGNYKQADIAAGMAAATRS
jgi:hypothetical protein